MSNNKLFMLRSSNQVNCWGTKLPLLAQHRDFEIAGTGPVSGWLFPDRCL